MQLLLFTTHTRRRRKGSIENMHTEFDQDKIENITRQLMIVQFYQEHIQHMQEETSCRYMILDNRLATKLLTTTQAKEVAGENVLLHRCYLYLPNECTQNARAIQEATLHQIPSRLRSHTGSN